MVFVRKVKTASGATAVQIAERIGGRDKVLEHLGSAHTDELGALLATARDRLHPGQGELDLSAGKVPTEHAVITGKRSALLWQVLSEAYARLGFDVIGDDAFQQLVLARLIEPTSKADSLRVLDEVPDCAFGRVGPHRPPRPLVHGPVPHRFGPVGHAFHVADARVVLARPGRVWLELRRRDPLEGVLHPASPGPVALRGVPLGMGDDGKRWRFRVEGTHALVAGATGAGKGSVLWSLVHGLSPAIREGWVQVWAIDPK
mgnify:CR=1 FL=1